MIEQAGFVRSFFADAEGQASTLLTTDLTSRAIPGPDLDERGLLGIALHPRFPEDPRVFLAFTTNNNGLAEQLSSFVVQGGTLDLSSEVSLLTVPDPYSNHNGGALAFGPDGYLYYGLGDGGDGGDPQGNGQNTDALLGKILRIDVDDSSAARPYGIPADNPFATAGGAPEIYAYGLRNPWRFSFDREDGRLWVGDVGQNAWEEVDIVERGGNYGWNVREGNSCFLSPGCSEAGFKDPVHVYANPPGNGSASVTGGYVYRGTALPDLVGNYVFADFVSGEVWHLVPDGNDFAVRDLVASGVNISSFAEDNDAELYALDYGAGRVLRFDPGTGSGSDNALMPLLSLTGCVNPKNPSEVTSAAVPYDVALPFWSDGAEKERYVALPDGTTLTTSEDGDLDLPAGGVAMKNFRHNGQLIETRFYVRHADGEHSGYSYAWREDGSDAELVEATFSRRFGDFNWTYPGRNQCNQCHTAAAGRTLGLELRQIDINNSDVDVNQVEALRALGMLDGSARADRVFFAEGATLGERARAYLHVNCSACHQPLGPGRGGLDLRAETALTSTGLCGTASAGNLGLAAGRIVTPGTRADSVLYLRINTRNEAAMPPLGSQRVDETAVTLLGDYIDALSSCP